MDLNICNNASHETVKFVVGGAITVGLFVSYIPQFHKFLTTRSSDGISSLFLLLGAVGGTGSFFNMVLLQYPNIQCCLHADWTPSFCIENTLGLFQVGTQFACFAAVFVLFYVFFPRRTSGCNASDLRRIHRERRTASVVATVVSIFLCVTVGAVMWGLVSTQGSASVGSVSPSQWLAGVLGLISTATSVFMWMPQIVETWIQRRAGALSIPMLAMQAPGSFVFVYSIVKQPGANWTSWVSYLVAGILQFVLLIECVYFARTSKASSSASSSESIVEELPVANSSQIDLIAKK
ncbi:hypothetical protein BJ742DRAFT_485121 [Cladochytrium replicatum]|nr:hypothetical protein BJ742DRAFT_485121 [Cladochytrium replicatum]